MPAQAAQDNLWYEQWRARELSRVNESGIAYLDYTGAALAPSSLLFADFTRLNSTVLGNPHSEHSASRASTGNIERARAALLDWFHADPCEYAVIFTANASGACRLVGESFPFDSRSKLLLSADNHNSINGLREFSRTKGAQTIVLPLDGDLRLSSDVSRLLDENAPSNATWQSARDTARSLFAFPAQSNFSGVRHPLSLINDAQARGFRVLLDAAAFVPTSPLRLDQVHPDFVVLSLYKMVGYPSGVGALIARHEALSELHRPWFAGGTVDWVSIAGDRHRLRYNAERFEDGTPAFAAAGAVPRALESLAQGEPDRLLRQLSSLTESLLERMQVLHHANGNPVVRVHGPRTNVARGATVACTIHDSEGRVVPYWNVEETARTHAVAIRGGCFCNPGCAERAFDFPAQGTVSCLEQLGDEFTIPKFAHCLGDVPVGAIRVSLGLGSVSADVDRAIALFASYCDAQASPGEIREQEFASAFSN